MCSRVTFRPANEICAIQIRTDKVSGTPFSKINGTSSAGSVPSSSGGERRWSLRERRPSEHVRGSEINSLFLFLRAIFRGNWGAINLLDSFAVSVSGRSSFPYAVGCAV
jgi:hypothetical protein